jgi:lysozyme
MSYRDIAKPQISNDEGLRLKLYKCPAGKLTIGYGHNIEDRGISQRIADLILEEDMDAAESDAKVLFPSFDRLSDARKAVIVNMSLNLGLARLAGFKRFRAAVEAGAWEQAAAEMIDSAWRHQVGDRAIRLAMQMRDGETR